MNQKKIFSVLISLIFSVTLFSQENYLKSKFTHFGVKSIDKEEISKLSGYVEFYKNKIVFNINNQNETYVIKNYEFERNTIILSNLGEIYFKKVDNNMQIIYQFKNVSSYFFLEKNDYNLFVKFYNDKTENFNYYEEGRKLLQAKKYIESIENLNKAIELNAYSSSAYFFRASSYAGIGELNKSIQDLNKAIEIDNTKPIFYILRGDCYSKLQNDNQTIIEETTAISLDSKNYLAYKIRGFSNYYLKNYESAIEDFNFVINYYNSNSRISKDGNVYLYRGLSNFKNKEYGKSCDDISIAKNLGIKEADKLYADNCK